MYNVYYGIQSGSAPRYPGRRQDDPQGREPYVCEIEPRTVTVPGLFEARFGSAGRRTSAGRQSGHRAGRQAEEADAVQDAHGALLLARADREGSGLLQEVQPGRRTGEAGRPRGARHAGDDRRPCADGPGMGRTADNPGAGRRRKDHDGAGRYHFDRRRFPPLFAGRERGQDRQGPDRQDGRDPQSGILRGLYPGRVRQGRGARSRESPAPDGSASVDVPGAALQAGRCRRVVQPLLRCLHPEESRQAAPARQGQRRLCRRRPGCIRPIPSPPSTPRKIPTSSGRSSPG